MREGEVLRKRVQAAKQHDPLTPLIDKYLIERRSAPKPWFPADTYVRGLPGHFSAASMDCMRAATFKFYGVEGRRKVTPEQQLIFDTGDWTHWMWFSMFRHMEEVLGPDVFKVIAIEDTAHIPHLYLQGAFDVTVLIRGRLYIIDFKTANDRRFNERIHQRAPEPGHVDQLIRYLRSRKIKRGLIVYINKNDQRYKVFSVRYSKEQWANSARWLKRAIRYMERRQVPPMHPECTSESWMARNCPYAHICYKVKSPDRLRAIAYDNKPSPRELWEAHN